MTTAIREKPAAQTTGFDIDYRVKNPDLTNQARTTRVEATPAQIRQLEDDGYLVQERFITGDALERLRDAVDEVAARAGGAASTIATGTFSGQFVRNLLDSHPAFLEMLKYAPTLSVARAVLGPQVQVHAFVARVSYPDASNQGVSWHFHQRVIPEPLPAFFSRPAVLDNLIYLDDVTEDSGPLLVVPGSHILDEEIGAGDNADKPGQVMLTVPAGSCVTIHASLWHRALPTRPGSGVRRLIILAYSPTWMKQSDRTGGGLTDALLPGADEETRELLGVGGWY